VPNNLHDSVIFKKFLLTIQYPKSLTLLARNEMLHYILPVLLYV